MVTLFTSSPALTVVLSVVVVCLVLFSLVSAAFLVNKDVYWSQLCFINGQRKGYTIQSNKRI